MESHAKNTADLSTPDKLNECRKWAIRYAGRMGFAESGEDFASSVMISILQGRWNTGYVNLKWAWVDYQRLKGVLTPDSGAPVGTMVESIINPDLIPIDEKIALSQLVSVLPKQVRMVLILKFKYGLIGSEIADLLQVSAARVGHILEEGLARLRNRI